MEEEIEKKSEEPRKEGKKDQMNPSEGQRQRESERVWDNDMKGNEPGRRNPQESITGKITRENKRKPKKETFPSNLVFHPLLFASHSPAVTLSLLGPV